MPDTDAVSVYEPYDKSPFDSILAWMKSNPTNKEKYRDVFQSNRDYDINEDFASTLRMAEAGNEKAVNVVLIGALAANSDISKDAFIEAINKTVPPKFLEVNLKAFELGYNVN